MAEFTMPALGADMEEGTLVEWRVEPGDEIRKGDIIAVVDTAKSAIEVESFHTGTVEALLAEVGQTVPVGTVLARIAETVPQAVPEREAAEATATVSSPAGAAPRSGGAAPRSGGAAPTLTAATPLVRREAQHLGVDLAGVQGTGPGGAITRADVERVAAAAAEPEPAPRERRRVSPLARRTAAELGIDLGTITGTGPGAAVGVADVRRAARAATAGTEQRPPARAAERTAGTEQRPPARAVERTAAMRQAIARLMARSKREIPHYYLSNTVDMGQAMTWLRERNRALPMSGRIVPAALLLKAAALAAREIPEVNGYWVDDRFDPATAVHLGVAISLRGGGLVTPAVHDADRLGIGDLMGALRDLVNRARAGRLRRAELTEATLTVTNLGDQGVESVTGVIYPPQVALVGFGKVVERPWAAGGLLGVRPVVVTTLAADHRATDGYTGARYLAAIEGLLQRPDDL